MPRKDTLARSAVNTTYRIGEDNVISEQSGGGEWEPQEALKWDYPKSSNVI